MDSYLPIPAKIVEIKQLSHDIRYFKLELEKTIEYTSGQFVMVTCFGVGESAISITSPSRGDNFLEIAVRKAGNVTGVLHSYGENDVIGIRGPFGRGFDIKDFIGKDVLLVCGGLGIVPLRSFIIPLIERSEEFGQITIIAGAKNPSNFIFNDEIDEWEKKKNVKIHRLVDGAGDDKWDYDVGLVTDPIESLKLNPEATMAVLCGPPVMYKFVIMELAGKGIPSENIFVDLERRMNCGVGACGHCQIQNKYVCKDGPVFNFSEIKDLPEALQ